MHAKRRVAARPCVRVYVCASGARENSLCLTTRSYGYRFAYNNGSSVDGRAPAGAAAAAAVAAANGPIVRD